MSSTSPRMDYRRDAMIAAFRVFDVDGSGKIPTEAMVTILKGIGKAFNSEEAKEFLADADEGGFIEYEAYCKNVIFSC